MRNSKTKGFTLIELIVVMAIIGVLAAILVPSMIGYLNDSKYSKANANAKQVYQSAANWCTKCEVNNHPVPSAEANGSITDPYDNAELKFDASKDDLLNALKCYMGGKSNSGEAYVVVTNSAPTTAKWRGGKDDNVIGGYPKEFSASEPGTWDASSTEGEGGSESESK